MGGDYKVRALTMLDTAGGGDLLGALEDRIALLSELRDRVSLNAGLEVETIRLVLEGFPLAEWAGMAEKVSELAEDYGALVSIGSLNLEEALGSYDMILKLLEHGIFFNVLLPRPEWEYARQASRLFHLAAEADPSYATLFGVNVAGTPLRTAYYPLASANGARRSIAVSLTYPNYLAEAYRRRGLEGLKDAVLRAARHVEANVISVLEGSGLEYAGIDLSVAPWMRESSLALVELVAGVRMPEPGFLLGIRLVNNVLGMAARNVKSLGFNEVQLPVAEDLKLKARVSELDTTARDLARFTCACLAGLDLAVVPANIDAVAGLILDTAACSMTKGRVLGVRIVPVEDVEPGDKVWLDKFGETPVIPI